MPTLSAENLKAYIEANETLHTWARRGNDAEIVAWFAAEHETDRTTLDLIRPDLIQALVLSGALAARALPADTPGKADLIDVWNQINIAAAGIRDGVSLSHPLIQSLVAQGTALGLLSAEVLQVNTTRLKTRAEVAFEVGATVTYNLLSAAFAVERENGVPEAPPPPEVIPFPDSVQRL